ncbi:MAG: putative zinc-binding protein [Chloroflexota bacterium]
MIESNRETAGFECECRPEEIVLLSCSGASNCGQITNQVAVKLTQEGRGKMYCLAGIGAHHDGMVESAKGAKRIVALDGCKTACAKNTTEHAGLNVTDWVCVTEAGIEKVHQFKITPDEVELVARRALASLAKPLRT